ncbi:MAG: hypothetical protein Q9221_002835 [Calogaya cf. arnoldii]
MVLNRQTQRRSDHQRSSPDLHQGQRVRRQRLLERITRSGVDPSSARSILYINKHGSPMAGINPYVPDNGAYLQSAHHADLQHNATTSQVAAVGAQMAHHIVLTQNIMENRFDMVDRKIVEDVDKRFDDLEAKVDGIQTIVDDRLGETEKWLNRRLDRLDSRFKALEKKMDFQHENMRALSHKGLCIEGWQYVLPVCRPGAEGRRILSPSHYYTVRSFWRLKEVTKRNDIAQLLYYYKVQGYRYWGAVDSVAEALLSSYANTCDKPELTAAVHSYPDFAHRALALELGLPYNKIQANMKLNSTSDHAGAAALAAGGASSPPSQDRKRRRADTPESADSPPMSTIPEYTQPAARRNRRKRSTR